MRWGVMCMAREVVEHARSLVESSRVRVEKLWVGSVKSGETIGDMSKKV